MAEFQAELERFQVQLPGGEEISFCDNEEMIKQMINHYGDWVKKPGKVTPIPLVRVPRVFLHNNQMPEFLKKRFQPVQKGEDGEMKIFKCLLGLQSLNLDVGLAVFPNVDSNCFQHLDAHVEIDLVLIHPKKGVFVFNVKNTERVKAIQIADDVKKHGGFLRRLCSGETESELPINTVVCSLKKKLNEKFQRDVQTEIGVSNTRDAVFFFHADDVKEFSHKWQELITPRVADLKQDERELVEILSIRLFGMNVMTGSLFHIHNQFVEGGFQKKKYNDAEFEKMAQNYAEAGLDGKGDDVEVDRLKDDYVKLSVSDVPLSHHGTNTDKSLSNNHQQAILLTQEQIKVIAKLTQELRQPGGCRIIVEGGKGTGKTLIMMQIAFLAQNDKCFRKIVVADGRLGASLVFLDEMRKYFLDSKVVVADTADLGKQSRDAQLIMFDECNSLNVDLKDLEKFASEKMKMILFASRSIQCGNEYTKLALTNVLRMSFETIKFCEDFRVLDPGFHELKLQARHNSIGANPCVDILEPPSNDSYHELFVESAVSNIEDALKRGVGLKSMLIAPFIHASTLRRILDALEGKDLAYNYRHPVEKISPHRNLRSNDEARIIIGTGNHTDGSEYGAVLVLLDASLPIWWSRFLHGSMYIAMTRATVHLKILLNATTVTPSIGTSDFPSFSEHVVFGENEMRKLIEQNAEGLVNTTGPILFFGSIPSTFQSAESPSDYLGLQDFSYRWYEASNGKSVIANESMNQLSLTALMKSSLNPSIVIIAQRADDLEISSFSHNFDRHGFLFSAVENPAWNRVPVIWVHPSENIKEELHILPQKVAKFCMNHGRDITRPNQNQTISDPPVSPESWRETKEAGSVFYKSNDFCSAIAQYEKAAALLGREYEASFHKETWSLQKMQEMRRDRAILHCNLSNAYFNDASSEPGGDGLEKSLLHAKEAILMDPTNKKGWYWAKKSWQELGQDVSLEEMRFKEYHKLNIDLPNIEEDMRQEKIRKSSSWDFLRFKENAYLVDTEGNGHYTSLNEAWSDLFNQTSFSLLLRPGNYSSFLSNLLCRDFDVDIVGDWKPLISESTGKLSQDPPIFISSKPFFCLTMIELKKGQKLRIARVTMSQEKGDPSHIIVALGTDLKLYECSLRNEPENAAIVGASGSKLLVDRCRFIGGFHPILSTGKSAIPSDPDGEAYLRVTNSTFVDSEWIGIELRVNVTAEIETCQFSGIGKNGIAAGSSPSVNVANCIFEKSAFNLTLNEGAMQFLESNVIVKDTIIRDQKGHGIVIEGGGGELMGLGISHCGQGGILAFPRDSSLSITNCKISFVSQGIVVCENGHEIIMSNNVISDCTNEIHGQGPNAKKPLMKDTKHEFVCSKSSDVLRPSYLQSRKKLLSNPVSRRAPQHEGDANYSCNCERCGLPITDMITFQSTCRGVSYCSEECQRKHGDYHQAICDRCPKSNATKSKSKRSRKGRRK